MSEPHATGGKSASKGAYGAHLAASFRLPEPPTHVRRTLQRGTIAVSVLRGGATGKPSGSLGFLDAYQVIVPLKSIRQEIWQGSRFVSSDPVQGGTTYIIDLREDPRVLCRNPGGTVHFYMPISTMKAYAEQNDLPAFADFIHRPTTGHDDPVMRHLSETALAALDRPHATTGLLLDSILDAACINVLGQYATLNGANKTRTYGLAAWQERRAKDLINSQLDVSMAELARECRISVAHFGRAFKRTTGMSPHQWQLGRRMQRAQAMLSGSTLSIAEIALACGFSSQSHFTNSFTENVGVGPGRWRRSGDQPETIDNG